MRSAARWIAIAWSLGGCSLALDWDRSQLAPGDGATVVDTSADVPPDAPLDVSVDATLDAAPDGCRTPCPATMICAGDRCVCPSGTRTCESSGNACRECCAHTECGTGGRCCNGVCCRGAACGSGCMP